MSPASGTSDSSAVSQSDAERTTNPRDDVCPLEDVEDTSVDPDPRHTSVVAKQDDGDVDGCREDVEGLQRQANSPDYVLFICTNFAYIKWNCSRHLSLSCVKISIRENCVTVNCSAHKIHTSIKHSHPILTVDLY